MNENKEVNELEDKEIKPKEKESETDAEQNKKNEDTDCLGKIPMGAKDCKTQNEVCYSKYEEILLDEANNGKVDNLEVKEIEVESSIKREEGSEDMQEESEGLQTERIHGKESDIEIVELIEKENELNNQDLKRKVPVNEVNNGVKTVPEVLEIINENGLN